MTRGSHPARAQRAHRTHAHFAGRFADKSYALSRGLAAALTAACIAAVAPACVNNDGVVPPLGEFHYPVGAAASPDGKYLYLLNSDFNLEFNGGMVSVVDLDLVRAAIDSGEPSPPATPATTTVAADRRMLSPENRFIKYQVRTRPFGNTIVLSPDAKRLYVSVRGDGTVTWIDRAGAGTAEEPAGSRLSCGESAWGELCDGAHTPGRDSDSGPRMLDPLPQPASVAAAPGNDGRGAFVVTPHSESPVGRLSLYYDNGDTGPQLQHWIGALSSGLWGVLTVPPPAGVSQRDDGGPRWLAFARTQPVVHTIRVFEDSSSSGTRSFAMRTRATVLTGVPGDLGLRDMVLDPCDARVAYALARPLGNDSISSARVAEQLLRIDLTDPDLPMVSRTMALPVGVSRVIALRPSDGRCDAGDTTRLLVSLFDSRKVYVIDGTAWRELAQLRTQAGPTGLVADACQGRPECGTPGARRELVYLIDFLAMCIEVIDVDPASPTNNRVIYTIGDANRPRESL